jgi:flagellar protein FliO/FliZ
MRGALEPIFGETGAVFAQYVITLVVVLLLVGLIAWLVRHYARGSAGNGARGRLPRLAIVDALPIDSRRRLVLVRRDNIEHLILIGGTSDVVVEPGIVRTRVQQRPAQPQPQTRAPGAAPTTPSATAPAAPPASAAPRQQATLRRAEASGIDEPIPFQPRQPQPPPRRVPKPPPARRETLRPSEAPAAFAESEAAFRTQTFPEGDALAESEMAEAPATAHFGEIARPTRVERALRLPDEVEAAPKASEPNPYAPVPRAVIAEPALPPLDERSGEPEAYGLDFPLTEPPSMAPDSQEAESSGTTQANVSDLEKEMARLLGEISGRRHS